MIKKILLNFSFCAIAIASKAQATLPTFWSFVSPSPSGVTAANPNAPIVTYSEKPGWSTKIDISVTGTTPFVYATGSDGNAACRLDGTGEFVQINIADKPGQLSYYLKGTGIGTPSFTGIFDIQQSIDGITWTNLRSFTTAAPPTGTFARFTETPAANSRYIRFFYTTKESGTNIALDSVFIQAAAAATTPTIQLFRNNIAIANNTQNIVGNNATFTFKVKNTGTIDTLVINNINFTGKDANAYAITNSFPIKIAANDSAALNCTLNTSGNGSKLAAINIFNNDADKLKFIINLYGIAGNFATEPRFKSTNISFTNVTAYGMNVSISDTSSTTENYLVLRKKNGTITEIPTDGVTYQRGDYIGAAQVAYIGKVGTFKPAYILVNSNYSFAVFSFNGPATYENYLTSSPNTAPIQSLTSNPGSYYNTINPSSSNFLTALSAKINVHDSIFYGNYTATLINNFLTRDTSAGKKVVNCVYTGIPYIYNEPFVWYVSGGTGLLTREHTRAQSTMPSKISGANPSWPNAGTTTIELPEYNDQHNLFPAHQTQANAVRSNNPFGECVTVTSTSSSGFGKLGKDANGNTVYEPKDTQKGDLARALFYMSVSYNGAAGNVWTLPADQGLAVLMKWHQQDPPSDEEISRHEYIASIQKNRNPFIDNPSWANLIDFKTMTLIPTLKLLTPISTDIWGGNMPSFANITWQSNLIDSVSIKLNDGANVLWTKNELASKGTISVPVPNVYTANAKVFINAIGGSLKDSSAIFAIHSTVGVNEVSNANFNIYPNPSNGTIYFTTDLNLNHASFEIFDVTGKLIIKDELSNTNSITIQNKGIYILKAMVDGKSIIRKIVVE